MKDDRLARVENMKAIQAANYGAQNQFAREHGALSTGSLLWDYMTGIGGHPMGALVEVFGAPSIGKTTIAGCNVLRSAHAAGMITGMILTEPGYTEESTNNWLLKNGVDINYNIIHRPDSGEEAFEILSDWVHDGPDYILFDSLGALSSAKELKSDKAQAFGNSAMITWGVSRVVTRAWKNNVGVMFINQQRDDTKSKIAGLVDSPGGHGMKHDMIMRTHLKPGKDRWTVPMTDGVENKNVLVGREIVASFKKNKAAEALGRAARFNFFHIETDKYGFGMDIAADVIAAGKVSGVIQGTGWYKHPLFPGGKIQGKEKLAAFFADHPEKINDLREDVLKVMREEEGKKAAAKAQLKAVSNE